MCTDIMIDNYEILKIVSKTQIVSFNLFPSISKREKKNLEGRPVINNYLLYIGTVVV